jgi:hypothetical protein
MMQDDDIIPLEALDLLRNASDELLSKAALGEIDLGGTALPPPRSWPAVDRRNGTKFRPVTRENAYNRIRLITPC